MNIIIATTTAIENRIQIDHDPILMCKSIRDFSGKIDPRFSFSNRSAIEKPIAEHPLRRNDTSGSDFHMKIDPRFSFQNQSAILFFQSRSDFHFQIAITIAIENRILIDWDPISIAKSDPEMPEVNKPS